MESLKTVSHSHRYQVHHHTAIGLFKIAMTICQKRRVFKDVLKNYNSTYCDGSRACSNIEWKLSRGELFLKFQLDPLSNSWDIGSKCCYFGPQPRPYRPLFGQIKKFETCLFALDVLNFNSGKLYSRAAPSVWAHHSVNSPDAGENSGERRKKNLLECYMWGEDIIATCGAKLLFCCILLWEKYFSKNYGITFKGVKS